MSPPTRGSAETAAGLIHAIERLRQSDARFRAVQTEAQGGVVRLRGVVQRWDDLFELAQAIARLPGVERVVLLDVRTPTDRR
jgi:hypothetical protein